MSSQEPDRRVTPYREDLAAARLRGIVSAPRYVEPRAFRVLGPSVPLRRGCDPALGYETELLAGEIFEIYEIARGWAWGQARRDGYVGYAPEAAFAPLDQWAATHKVTALRSFLYAGASIKTAPLGFLPHGAQVMVETIEGRFARTADGYLFAADLGPLEDFVPDPVTEAERFLGVPYIWGGKTSLGLDCSGLAQTACIAAGIAAPRDSDMQEKALGLEIASPNRPEDFARGDLLFWPGHVALSQGEGRMIHATGHAMRVISEPIEAALIRIAAEGHPLRTVRRLSKA